ncbi:MAG: hypothetical protein ACI4PU_07265 [Intestinibacter sp.]
MLLCVKIKIENSIEKKVTIVNKTLDKALKKRASYHILDKGLEKNAFFNISKNFTPATSTLKGGLPGGSLLNGSLSKYNSQSTSPTKNYAQILKPVEKVKGINPTSPIKGVIGK